METFFIFGAKYLFLLSALVATLYFNHQTFETKRRMLIFGIASFGLAFVISLGARAIFDNPRPFVVGGFEPLINHEADNGFPSDHTLLAAAIASLIIFFNIHIGIWLWLIAGIVGLSRVYVGVHHFTDIIASGVIAALSAITVYAIIHTSKNIWRNKNT